jgi:hypothetical protein
MIFLIFVICLEVSPHPETAALFAVKRRVVPARRRANYKWPRLLAGLTFSLLPFPTSCFTWLTLRRSLCLPATDPISPLLVLPPSLTAFSCFYFYF